MKKNSATYITALILTTAIVVPPGLIAQDGQHNGHQPHHYQLIDVGTFGGPQSSIVDQGVPGGVFVNNSGVFTGYSDTRKPDPFQNFCFLDCFVDHAFEWKNGLVTDLGVLHHGLSSAPVAISKNGLLAGFAQNGETDPLFPGFPELRAVLWQNGHITDLGTLPEGGYESMANSVNSRGQVVGFALNTIPDPDSFASITTGTFNNLAGSTQSRAFLWENGAMQDLGTLGGPDAAALLINERGQAMGWSYTSFTQAGACLPLATGSFIWEKENGMRDLGNFGGTCTLAQDINNRGQVVGWATPPGDAASRAFLWENGSISDLGGSLGGDATGAFAVNDAGHAAGFGYLAGDPFFHAAFWKKMGQITDLGTIGDDPCSSAKAINAKDQVVGDSISLSNCLPGGSEDSTRAFLWEDGAIFDLNALIPHGSPLYLIHPQTINERGEIAGLGVDADGNQHAFLLIPCDENHPGVDGCDYSMVDASATPNVTPRSVPLGLAPQRQSRLGSHGAFNPLLRFSQNPGRWNRALRTQTGSSSLNRNPEPSVTTEKSPDGAFIDDTKVDQARDPAFASSFPGPGHCIEGNGRLTGSCALSLHVGPGCTVIRTPMCPRGAIAKKPGLTECCGFLGCGKITVDLAMGCR